MLHKLLIIIVVLISIDAMAQDDPTPPPPTPREVELSSQLSDCRSELAELKRPPVQQQDGSYIQSIEDLQQRIEDASR